MTPFFVSLSVRLKTLWRITVLGYSWVKTIEFMPGTDRKLRVGYNRGLKRYTPSLVRRGHFPCLGQDPGYFRNHNERNNHWVLYHWNVSGRTQTLRSVRRSIQGISEHDIHVFSREVVDIKDEDQRSHASLEAVSESRDDCMCRKWTVAGPLEFEQKNSI